MNIEKIATLAARECIRQQVGLDRVAMLLMGYQAALSEAAQGNKPTYRLVMQIAGVVEPHNNGRLRTTPVTFASGGGSVAPNNVSDAMFRLFQAIDTLAWPESAMTYDWVKQFLYIHPFTDGNGRMAWILFNWLDGSLDNPVPLPDFFGQNA